jgi:2-aminoadipate transaminase
MIAEVMKDGFLDRHVPTIRALYKSQRDAMLAALAREIPVRRRRPRRARDLEQARRRHVPVGAAAAGMDAVELLPKAVDKGVAFVPGLAFYADNPDPRSLRLSFVTPSVAEIERGVAALAQAVRESLPVAA